MKSNFNTKVNTVKCLLVIFVLFTGTLPIFGQGMEDFTNSTATASYSDGSFTGNNGVVWTFGHSRNEDTYPIEGNGLILRRGSDSYLEATITGGIGTISFQYRKAYTGGNNRQLVLLINGEGVDTTEVFGTATGEDATIHTLSYEANIAETATVKIKDVATNTTNRQTTIDNIIWTGVGQSSIIAQFSATPRVINEGETVSFTDASYNGTPTSWSWTFEGGTPATSTEQNPTVTYATAGVYDVTLTVSDGTNSDTKTVADYITVNIPVITIFNQDWDDQEWSGWTQISVDTEGITTWGIDSYGGNYYAYINGYNKGMNEDWLISPSFNLNNYEGVVFSFRNAKNYTGPDIEVYFSNNYDGINIATATWQPLTFAMSSGGWSWATSGDISFDEFSGTDCYVAFKYTCTASTAAGWEVDDILLTAVSEAGNELTADFTGTPTTLYEGETVTFADASTGNPTSWNWTFDGGNPATSIEQNPIVTYATAGVYDVTLTVSDGTESDTKTIADYITVETVPTLPTANFTASATIITEGGTVAFTNTSTGIITGFAWTFEGGEPATSTEENPTVTYATAGTYDVQLVATDGTNFDTLLREDYILVNAAGEIICNNSFEYWTNGLPNCWKGSKSSFSDENIVQYTESAHSGNSACQLINTGNSHKRFTSQPTSVIAGVEYEISFWVRGAGEVRTGLYDSRATGSGYSSYNDYVTATTEWTQYSQTVTAEMTVDVAEFIFSVRNTVETDGHLQIDDVEITENIPSVLADFGANITDISEGDTVLFSDLSIGEITTWNWTFEGGTPDVSTEQNPSITYNESGVYDVTLVVSDGVNFDTITKEDYITVFGGIVIFNQDWNDQEWNGWNQISVLGNQVWEISPSYGVGNTPCAKMSGYSGGAYANEDWLISPSFNLNNFADVVLSFQNAFSYDGNPLEVFFSNDYNGSNPVSATWQPLSFTISTGSFAWTYSGEISLDGFSGTDCYIAFKYTCDDAAASTWEIDDILLLSSSAAVLTADFTATPTSVIEGGTVSFTDASTGNPTTWSWTFEGGTPATSTEQNPVVTYATEGIYSVTLTISDGTNTNTKTIEDYITVTRLSISEMDALSVKCYPNPTSGIITLETETKDVCLTIFDVTGKTLLQTTLTDNNGQIDISTFNTGFYFIKVVSTKDGLQKIIKIVKND